MLKGIDHIGVSVVYFCHDGKGNFVMAKRSQNARDEHGRWDVGAGGVEIFDSVDTTLKKEIKEEYSTEVLDYEFLGFRDVLRQHNDNPTHWITLDFKVLVNAGLVANGEPHKMDEVKWFSKDTLPPLSECHSQLGIFLDKYKNRLWS